MGFRYVKAGEHNLASFANLHRFWGRPESTGSADDMLACRVLSTHT
ncbi:MAG: hypothetical protein ACJA08_002750 [Cyclobacteriaceae bacterium]|jgi:hypothetical protein